MWACGGGGVLLVSDMIFFFFFFGIVSADYLGEIRNWFYFNFI